MIRAALFALGCLSVGLSAGCGGARRSASIQEGPAEPVASTDSTGSKSTARSNTVPVGHDAAKGLPPNLRYDISAEEIGEHVEKNTAIVIDARSPGKFEVGHVRGALNLPAGQIDAYMGRIRSQLSDDQLIIVYCEGEWCGSADMVAEYLTDQGFSNIRVYSPGWVVLSSRDFAKETAKRSRG